MEFPVLPQSEYTNALIFVVSDGYHLVLSDSAFALRDVDPLSFDGEYRYWARYELDGDAWVARDSQYSSYDPVIDEIIWANYDVLDPEANLYMAKSVPVTIFAVTHTVNADLLERGVRPRIDVVQGDSLTRRVEFILTAGGVPWTPPEDTTAAISYVRPDGAGEVYDALPDGTEAYTVSGNRIRFTLLPEMLTVAGEVMAALRIVRESDGRLLSSFPIDVVVEPEPSYLVRPVSNDTPTEPDAPAAALYLYGTPSSTGNIGLRSGGVVTYYEGIVAAALPERDETVYPCAYIAEKSSDADSLHLCYAAEILHQYGTYGVVRNGAYQVYYFVNGAWVYEYTYSGNGSYSGINDILHWSNVDILYRDSTELAIAKSDPIPLGEIVDYDGDIPIYEVIT